MSDQQKELASSRADANAVVRWLAFVLANGKVYGPDHKITRKSITDATQAMQIYLQIHGDLELAVVDQDFQLQGVSIGFENANTKALAKRFTELQAEVICVQKEITAEAFSRFMNMLLLPESASTQAGGLAGILKETALSGVHVGGYSYQRVTEDEAVVEKAKQTPSGLTDEAKTVVDAMLASKASDPAARKVLQKVDLGSEKVIADLVHIVAPPDSADALGADLLAQQAVERMQQISDSLLEDPAHRTQKGQRALRKILKLAEADVTERLNRLGADIEAVQMLAARVKELVEELAVDGLVAQYMKLRGSMTDKEKRLERHIKRATRRGKSEAQLRSQLVESGLPVEVLEKLSATVLGQGGASGGGGGAAKDADASAAQADAPPVPLEQTGPHKSMLSDLLKQLQNTKPGDGSLPQLVEKILGEMNKALQQTSAHAEKQMDSLQQLVTTPAGRSPNAELSRRQLLAIMAELGQELRQPLTIISSSSEMLLKSYFGDVTEEQRPILDMVVECSQNLDDLIDRMVKIVGMPATLQPDAELINPTK